MENQCAKVRKCEAGIRLRGLWRTFGMCQKCGFGISGGEKSTVVQPCAKVRKKCAYKIFIFNKLRLSVLLYFYFPINTRKRRNILRIVSRGT